MQIRSGVVVSLEVSNERARHCYTTSGAGVASFDGDFDVKGSDDHMLGLYGGCTFTAIMLVIN